MKPKNRIILLLKITIILSIIIFIIYLIIPKNKYIKETNYYLININIKNSSNKKINNKISKIITKEKKYLQKLSNQKKRILLKNNTKYKLKIKTNKNSYNNIIFFSLDINLVLDKKTIYEKHYMYYLDKNNNEISINKLFNTNNYLDILSYHTYYSLINYNILNNLNLSNNYIKSITDKRISNYRYLKYTNKGLEVLLNNNLNIIISYEKLYDILPKSLLKKEFPNKIKVKERNLNSYYNKKLIALTFDDGPGYNGTTTKLLKGLNKTNSKVTFFTLGSRVKALPNVIKEEYKNGHEVATHTYNHKNLTLLSDYELYNEIYDSYSIIEKTIGVKPKYLRPPYGSINKNIKNKIDLPVIFWSVDTLDWKIRNKKQITQNIISKVKDGDIVLLHDIYNTSVDGVLKAIDILYKQGYRFVTINELFKIRGITPTKGNNYSKIS